MNPHTCPHCAADLRVVGVREYGLVHFEIILTWDEERGWYEIGDREVEYDECHSLDWACRACGQDLGFDPNDPDEDEDEDEDTCLENEQ
jgi:hypothetical protein